MRFSVGYELTEPVRAAILEIGADDWVPALDQDGSERENGEVAEITNSVDLSAWDGEQDEPTRLIVRRERPHPGALQGDYVGATASFALGVGAGANALIGGFNKSVALQPVSIEGTNGLNVAAGIGAINLSSHP